MGRYILCGDGSSSSMPGVSRTGKQCLAAKYEVTTVTTIFIAYVAWQVRRSFVQLGQKAVTFFVQTAYGLSSRSVGHTIEGAFNFSEFYRTMLDIMETGDKEWIEDLVKYWNGYVDRPTCCSRLFSPLFSMLLGNYALKGRKTTYEVAQKRTDDPNGCMAMLERERAATRAEKRSAGRDAT